MDNNVSRRLKMEDVHLDIGDSYDEGFLIEARVYDDCKPTGIFELEVKHSRIAGAIRLLLTSLFVKFRFVNTVFAKVYFESEQQMFRGHADYLGLASFSFYNCTFTTSLCVDVDRLIEFKIVQSSINVAPDYEGNVCVGRLTGISGTDFDSNKELAKLLFDHMKNDDYMHVSSIFYMENTFFKSSIQPYWTITQADIFIENVLVNLVSIDRDINITFLYSTVNLKRKQVVCPLRINAIEILSLWDNDQHFYQCEATCTPGMTKLQSGLYETIFHKDKKKSFSNFYKQNI